MAHHFTQKEEEKLHVIKETLHGRLTVDQAAMMLGISPRQVKRLKKKVRAEGDKAVIHKLKGKLSNLYCTQEFGPQSKVRLKYGGTKATAYSSI